MKSRILYIVGVIATLATDASAQSIGPSTKTEPYLLPARAGVSTISLLTAGDVVGGYTMVGAPDGLGARFTPLGVNIMVNHELGKTSGIARNHGSAGAFVSRWIINPADRRVIAGRDHSTAPTDVFTWNGASYASGTTAFNRLCSADMAARGGYFFQNGADLFGTRNRIFLNGEETTPPASADHGRAFAHIITGVDKNKSFELPRFGKIAFENALASPYPQLKTVVMLTDDAGRQTNVTTAGAVCRTFGQTGCTAAPSELYLYIGTKLREGAKSDIENAGLTNGALFGVRVLSPAGAPVRGENKDHVLSSSAPALTSARFGVVNFGDVAAKTGVQLQDEAIGQQVTQFFRIEDGAWDPRPGKERDFYFNTTGRISADPAVWLPSRLWRLRFDDITRPELGGRIDMLLSSAFYAGASATPDADPGYQMFDNMTIDRLGRIVLLEDVGGASRIGRVYIYGIDSAKLERVAIHNSKFFGVTTPATASFLSNDEESSGVIDFSEFFGQGWFLISSMHGKAATNPAIVKGGQLLGLYIDPAIAR